MNLFPGQSESLLVSIDAATVVRRLRHVTLEDPPGSKPAPPDQVIFSGTVRDNGFLIYLRRNRPNSFQPRIRGKIEPTANGCLLFLDYQLPGVTRVYLVSWTAFVLFGGLVHGIVYHRVWSPLIGLVLTAIILWIAHTNFMIHLKRTREVLSQTLLP